MAIINLAFILFLFCLKVFKLMNKVMKIGLIFMVSTFYEFAYFISLIIKHLNAKAG